MTGVTSDVAAQLQENQNLTHMLNIHCICLCAFFQELVKDLTIYARTALKMHDLNTLMTNKHKKVVRKVKKVVSIR